MRHQHQQTIRQQSDQHPLSSATGTNSDQPATIVVETLEHRRFAEFCDACKRYRYIGLCYGSPGVGKTLSARHYSRWDYLEEIDPYAVSNEALGSLMGIRTMFYTTPVVNTPGQISSDIDRLRSRLQSLAREPLRREAAQKLKEINIRDRKHAEEMFVTHDWLSGPVPKLKPTYAAISEKYVMREKRIGDPTQLILVRYCFIQSNGNTFAQCASATPASQPTIKKPPHRWPR